MENEVESLFLRTPAEREALWRDLVATIETYLRDVSKLPLKRTNDLQAVRNKIASWDFREGKSPRDVLKFVVDEMTLNQTHFTHPGYFGLFDPPANPLGLAADAVTALFNPQLASSMQSLFPIELERHLIREMGKKLGLDTAEGCFTTGGAEANHTALLLALARRFPEFTKEGARALSGRPFLYVSKEAHHSFHKAARVSGLGDSSVRLVDIDDKLKMSVAHLRELVAHDRRRGDIPLFVVGTAGTTRSGTIDPLCEIANVAREENLWFHVDGAWGGAVRLSSKCRALLDGTELADSVTVDAHKWLQVPMGGGMFFTRHAGLLKEAFHLETGYIASQAWDVVEPYQASLQWSRRFIGLKFFFTLATVGWEGYAKLVEREIELGEVLRSSIRAAGFAIHNDTKLPVVCFCDDRDADAIAARVVGSGTAWISTVTMGDRRVLRASVVNYRTSVEDIASLIEAITS